MRQRMTDARSVAMVAVMSAVVLVLTLMIKIPTPAKGYIHLGDAAIFFAAFAFGPLVGGAAGGLGTALADLFGYPQWAVISLLVHGFQGWVVGAMVHGVGRAARDLPGWYQILSAVGVGCAVVVVGYLLGGVVLVGAGAALAEVPANIIQGLSGGLVGAPLYYAVRRAYPPLAQR